MEKVEYIRTLVTDTQSVLLILRVHQECFLSEVKLVFDDEESIKLPKIRVKKGDFVWITNMDNDEVNQIVSGNSSKTQTLILQIINNKYDLQKFKMLEEVKC